MKPMELMKPMKLKGGETYETDGAIKKICSNSTDFALILSFSGTAQIANAVLEELTYSEGSNLFINYTVDKRQEDLL